MMETEWGNCSGSSKCASGAGDSVRRRKKQLRIVLLSAGSLVVLTAAYFTVGHWIIREAYYGRSVNLLNNIIQGQEAHSLSFYLTLADRWLSYSAVLITAVSVSTYLLFQLLSHKDRSAKVFLAVFAPLSMLLATIAVLSLQWRMVHDSPIMLYASYLINNMHYVPYRDFFDPNLPGAYLVNIAVSKIFGYSDIGFRSADIAYLIAIMGTTWFWLRRLGWMVASFAVILFGLLYLGQGSGLSMQREYFIVLPLSIAILSATSKNSNSFAKSFLIGILLGLVATIKPHSALALPFLVAFQISTDTFRGRDKNAIALFNVKTILCSILGFLIPVLAMLIYLKATNAWSFFWDIVKNYWPLYSQLSGSHQIVTGLPRLSYLIHGYLFFGGLWLWLFPAVAGVYAAFFRSSLNSEQRKLVLLLAGLAITFSIYPVLAGKFWSYHWIIFSYFIVILSSLCFVNQTESSGQIADRKFERLLPIIMILMTIFLAVRPPAEFYGQLSGRGIAPPKGGRVDEIAAYLKEHMKPGDKVQPLDWTGGAVHAMLIAKAEIAAPYIGDYFLYHHISHPYIQRLRNKFFIDLSTSKPRFVIQVWSGKPWPSGPDTTTDFPELQNMLNNSYNVAFEGDGYLIYEKNQEQD